MKKSTEKNIPSTAVNVSVDVTKIVKYIALSGVAIVGIIFGTKLYAKMIAKKDSDMASN